MFVFSFMTSVLGAEPINIVGSLSLPRQWQVFGPLDQADPMVPPEDLKTIPLEINVSGPKLKPRTVNVDDPFNRLDLALLMGGTKTGKAAYVFIPFTSPSDMEATLGMGADWWLQAWLDGVPVMDTTKEGNGPLPPTVHDHLATVRLKKGAHVLAVRFISGSGSSILALGGPDDLRKGRPPYPLFQNDPMPAGNLVANGGFEEGLETAPFVPIGWVNGKDQTGFQKNELLACTNVPIAGSRSLEINTLTSGSGVKRKLSVPLSVDIDTCYEVSFKAYAQEGDGYASVSVRDNMNGGFNTSFIRAIGADNADKAIKKGRLGACRSRYFFDTPNPCLVIETHGPVHVVLDDVCIIPVPRVWMWSFFNEQRAPWRSAWNTLSEAVVTPHTAWAKPYAGGMLKMLSLMPRKKQRLTVELAQRLSMQSTPIFFEFRGSQNSPSELGSDYWIYDDDGDPQLFLKETDLVEKLAQPTDCIVIAELNPSAITLRMAEKILKKVSDGAGLVVTGAAFLQKNMPKFKESPWSVALNEANRTTEETAWVKRGSSPAENSMMFYRHGKGRIALWPGNMNDSRISLETDLPYLIKAMVWTSRKLPRIRIQDMELPGQTNGVWSAQVERDALPGRIKVKIASSLPVSKGIAVAGWMDDYRDDQPVSLGSVTLDGDHLEAAFDVPRLPAGQHRVHFQVKQGDGIEDWSTAILKVTASMGIKAIELDRKNLFFTAGDPIKGRVVLTTPLKPDQKLRIQLKDADGRLWATNEITSGTNTKIEFTVKTDSTVVLLHRIRAEIIDPAGSVADAEVEFAVARTTAWYKNFFDYQLWVVPTDSLLVGRELRKYGVTSSYHEYTGRNHALNNIRGNPQVNFPDWQSKIVGDVQHAPVRNPCLNDTEFHAQFTKDVEKFVTPVTKFGPLAYSFAHEWNLRSSGRLTGPVDVCFCTNCLASFRRFALEEYGSLTGINTAWGTDFKDLEEVTPVVLADALKANQIPRWIDHRRHMDHVLADFLKFAVDVLRKNNPDTQGSLSGMRSGLTTLDSYSGVDFWRLYHDAALTGYLDPYILSFIPREDSERRHLITRNQPLWHPDNNTGNEDIFRLRLGNKPWINLLDGAHGITYYEEYCFEPPASPWHPILNADLTVGILGPMNASIAQIRSGIDRVIFESKQMDSGIAILYSRSSEHAATAWQALHKTNSLAAKISPPDQMGFYNKALNACGYRFTMVSEDQVANRALTKDGFRLLILPFAQAISAGAAEQIREFVKGGGALLADIRPGMADQHGKPGTVGALDDVFGVRHQTDYNAYEPAEDVISMDGVIGKTALTNVLARVFCGPDVQVVGASVQGKGRRSNIPAFLVNRFDRGQAILLNFILPVVDDDALQMMNSLLTASGLRPLFGIEATEGRRFLSPTIVREPKDALAAAGGMAEATFAGAASVARPILSDFANGQIHCFGFWYPGRRGIGTERLRITPPVAGHIYDLKTNHYLGRQECFEVSLPLEDMAVYASVPYCIQQPTLTLTQAISSRGLPTINALAHVRPDEAAHEQHALKFRIFAPDGSEWSDFAATETTKNGMATHVFELPINAPKGKWKVTVREAISGLTESKNTDL